MSHQPSALTTIEQFGQRLRAREITAEQALDDTLKWTRSWR
jgi:hypothetical protein